MPYPSIPLQKESPAEAGLFFCADKPSLLIATLLVAAMDHDLSANFAPREIHGMQIHITGPLTNGAQGARKITCSDALSSGSRDIRGSDCAHECSRSGHRARGLAASATQEDHHTTCNMDFAEVNV